MYLELFFDWLKSKNSVVEHNQILSFNISRGLILLALMFPHTVSIGLTERFAIKNIWY